MSTQPNLSIPIEVTVQPQLVDITLTLSRGLEGPAGPTGAAGTPGAAATIAVGTVSTVSPSTPASVTNTGTSSAAVFDFSIPQGAPGATGPAGEGFVWEGAWDDTTAYQAQDIVAFGGSSYIATTAIPAGPGNPNPTQTSAWELVASKGDTGAPGVNGDKYTTTSSTTLTVSNGTKNLTVGLNLAYIPEQSIIIAAASVVDTHMHGTVVSYNPATGAMVADVTQHTGTGTLSDWEIGLSGAAGVPGPAGTAATIAVGFVTTGLPGSNVVITNTGTSSAAVFDFTIPRGDTGSFVGDAATITTGTLADARLSSNVTLGGNVFSGTGSILRQASPSVTGTATFNGSTVTTSTPVTNATQTWNQAGGLFTLHSGLVTDTASANTVNSASTANLIEYKVTDSVVTNETRFKVDKYGNIYFGSQRSGQAPTLYFNQETSGSTKRITGDSQGLRFFNNGLQQAVLTWNSPSGRILMLSGEAGYAWSSTGNTGDLGTTADLILFRDAAGQLALRNSTNPQTFRVYNTFVNTTNHERGSLGFVSNTLTLASEAEGTGIVRGFQISIGGTPRFAISTAGNITTGTWQAGTIALAYGGTGATTASAARTNLGLAIGTDVQAFVSATNTGTGGIVREFDSVFHNPTISTPKLQGYSIQVQDIVFSDTLTPEIDLYLVDASSGPIVISFPPIALPVGKVIEIKRIDSSSNAVTINAASVGGIDGENTVLLPLQNMSLTIVNTAFGYKVI